MVDEKMQANVAPDEAELTPSQKLKLENDALEAELIRAQKIRNEALLAGTAGGHVETVVSEEDAKKTAALEMFKGSEIAEAITKYNG